MSLSSFLRVAVVLACVAHGAGSAEEPAPLDLLEVNIDVYVCAAGDFNVLFNEAALAQLDECSPGIPATLVQVENPEGRVDERQTNSDGVVALGPIPMSTEAPGSMGIVAEGYMCLTIGDLRIGENLLQAGDNVMAVRLYRLDRE